MRLQPRIQENEIYKCINCDSTYQYVDIQREWRCPKCDKFLYIKVEIKGYEHSVQRVTPDSIRIGEIITLENEFIHEILNIEKKGNSYRLALKEYRVIEIDSNSIITRVEGSWF